MLLLPVWFDIVTSVFLPERKADDQECVAIPNAVLLAFPNPLYEPNQTDEAKDTRRDGHSPTNDVRPPTCFFIAIDEQTIPGIPKASLAASAAPAAQRIHPHQGRSDGLICHTTPRS
jgi:hypothetical protein